MTNLVEGNAITTPVYVGQDIILNKKYLIYSRLKTTTDQRVEVTASETLQYIKDSQVGYEGLFGAVKPYFDFDISYKTKKEQEANEYDDVSQCIEGVCGFLSCGENQISILGANGKKMSKTKSGNTKISWVNSIHIIVNNGAVYKDGKTLLSHIKTYDEWKIRPDHQPYSASGKRQLFRLPYCSKEGENRPFQRLTVCNGIIKTVNTYDAVDIANWMISQPDDVDCVDVGVKDKPCAQNKQDMDGTYQLWNLFVKALPLIAGAFSFDSYETDGQRTTINTKRDSPSHCDICDRMHDNDNTLYLLGFSESNQIMRGCIRKKKK